MTNAFSGIEIHPVQPFSEPKPPQVPESEKVTLVDASEHIVPGTASQQLMGMIMGLGGAAVTLLVLTIATFGIGLIAVLIGAWIVHHKSKLNRVTLAGSGLKVGPNQFGKIHAMVLRIAARLSMTTVPECYIIESSEQNAAAVKSRGLQAIVLTDDMIWGAMSTKDLKVLEFVIAHELAHHKLGHVGWLRSTMATANKTLGRLDEFTCDAVAAKIVGDPESSSRALALLTVGPQLLPKVNIDDLINQSKTIAENKLAVKAEKPLSHPLLLRRIARILGVEMRLK